MARRATKTKKFKDRYTGLVLFGVLEVGIGIVILLMGVGLSSMAFLYQETKFHPLLPSIVLFGGFGLAWIGLGYGSLLAKRWARNLLLIKSWGLMALGIVVAVTLLAEWLTGGDGPKPSYKYLSADEVAWIQFTVYGSFAVALILFPLFLILFYSSKDVKATVEARDPGKSWTDKVPLPLLVLCLMQGGCGLLALPMMAGFHFTTLLFGWVLSGFPGALLTLLLSGLNLYLAWGLYHLRFRAWWLTLAYNCLMGFSMIFSTPDKILEMDRQMGFPEAEITKLHAQGNFYFPWIGLFTILAMGGYLLFLKRYFPKGPARQRKIRRRKGPKSKM